MSSYTKNYQAVCESCHKRSPVLQARSALDANETLKVMGWKCVGDELSNSRHWCDKCGSVTIRRK